MNEHIQLTPGQPIADGICFDDIRQFTADQQRMLVGRGLVWLTSFEVAGQPMGGTVIAATAEQASLIVDARGLGETVFGVMGIPSPPAPPMSFPL